MILQKLQHVVERKFTYKPNSVDHGALLSRKHQSVRFGEEFGLDLHGAFVEHHSERVVLFFHGNKNNITRFETHYSFFDEIGVSYFTFDYPGYGNSSGSPTEQSLYASARAAYSFLSCTRKYSPTSIIVYGASLGAAVAAELLQTHNADSFISEAAFSSAREMGKELIPYLPIWSFFPDRYNNLKRYSLLKLPVFLLHGQYDLITPLHQAKQLMIALKSSSRISEYDHTEVVRGADHTSCLPTGGPSLKEVLGSWIMRASTKVAQRA